MIPDKVQKIVRDENWREESLKRKFSVKEEGKKKEADCVYLHSIKVT
jgi:hypothetical protein